MAPKTISQDQLVHFSVDEETNPTVLAWSRDSHTNFPTHACADRCGGRRLRRSDNRDRQYHSVADWKVKFRPRARCARAAYC